MRYNRGTRLYMPSCYIAITVTIVVISPPDAECNDNPDLLLYFAIHNWSVICVAGRQISQIFRVSRSIPVY